MVLNRNTDDSVSTASTQKSNFTSSAAGTQNGGKESVFGELANKPVDSQPRAVLAAGDTTVGDGMAAADDVTTDVDDTTPESTVPSTGISGPTAGIIISSTIFGIVGYILLIGPRKLALSSFEKNVLKDLD